MTIDLTHKPHTIAAVESAIRRFLASLDISVTRESNSIATDARGSWRTDRWVDVDVDGETTGEFSVIALMAEPYDDEIETPTETIISAECRDYRVTATAQRIDATDTERGQIAKIDLTWTTEAR